MIKELIWSSTDGRVFVASSVNAKFVVRPEYNKHRLFFIEDGKRPILQDFESQLAAQEHAFRIHCELVAELFYGGKIP
ncbi:hypothetical protein ACFBZI_07490 [Moraxella sp. ZJ142]|uniref:hypothetical protein n=1 Tax=Moraxella marmotae TaxID=3344520 RepID=UPI0035D4D1FB